MPESTEDSSFSQLEFSSSLSLLLALTTETQSHAHVCIVSGPISLQSAAISGGADENVTHFSSFPSRDGAGACVLSDRGDHHLSGAGLTPGGLMEGQGNHTCQEGKDSRSLLCLHPAHFLF